MKKLKIILPIFLISLFVFIGNVKAAAQINFNTQNYTPLQNCLNSSNCIDESDFWNNILNYNNLIQKDDDFAYYTILYDFSNNYLYYIRTNEKLYIRYFYNYGNNSLYLNYANLQNSKYRRIIYSFNSNGIITNVDDDGDIDFSGTGFIDALGDTPNNIFTIILATNQENYIYGSYSSDRNFSFSIDNIGEYTYQSEIPINFLNGTTYHWEVKDIFEEPTSVVPTIQPPYNTYHNEYTETTFIVDNYTSESVSAGYNVEIINNNNKNTKFITPKSNEPYQEITLTSYENTNYTIQIHDREYNILQKYSINANINYETNNNFSIEINNIDNNTREVFYKYIISDSNQNYTCYHSINNNPFIQDMDCMDPSTVYYNLTMPNNGNLAFKIEDNNGNIVYKYDQNIVFNVSETYISFQDNFDNNYLNLNVLINRYQSNDIIEYSINNSNFIQANLEDYSTIQNIKNFYINNLNNNDIIIVRVKRNNEIITYAKYKANYLKYSNNSEEDYNISNIFEKINIENINNELREYIKNFGNLIINSKIGNLLLLQTFCLVIILIIKMIRN